MEMATSMPARSPGCVRRASVVEHSDGFCNHLIEQDDALSGIIEELSTESQLIPLDVDEDIETNVEPFAAADGGERVEVVCRRRGFHRSCLGFCNRCSRIVDLLSPARPSSCYGTPCSSHRCV